MILYIKHIAIEGPETLEVFFAKHGFKSRVIEAYNGDAFPLDSHDIEAVVCLGGPMNVYEEEQCPYLKEEHCFIQMILKDEIPFLGICLGSQLLSKASNGIVTRSPVEEIGWRKISLTSEGKRDPLFKDLKDELLVYQWHGDMFSIPADGALLATGPDCPHQAFKVGQNAYGIQFHVEITERNIAEWSDHYLAQSPELLKSRKQEMLDGFQKNRGIFEKEAQTIYNNFMNIIKNPHAV